MKKNPRCGLSKAKIWILQKTLPQRFYLWVFAWHVLGGTSTPQRNHDAERDFLFSSAKSSFTTWREVPCLRPGASPVHQVAQLVQKHMLQVFNYASYHQPSWYYLKVYVWRPWFWFWLHCCLVTLSFCDAVGIWDPVLLLWCFQSVFTVFAPVSMFTICLLVISCSCFGFSFRSAWKPLSFFPTTRPSVLLAPFFMSYSFRCPRKTWGRRFKHKGIKAAGQNGASSLWSDVG